MYTTVIFDCGEVLIQGMKGAEHAMAKIVGCDAEHMREQMDMRPRRYAFFEGRISERVYWESMIETNAWPCTSAQLAEAMRENFIEMPGTRAIVQALRTAGYKLGLLSIHGREWVEYCETRHAYHQHFDVIQYSYEVGLRKPDRRVYEMILESLGSKPAETIFVDDKPSNVEAAEELGIYGIRFVSAEQVAAELESVLGIKIAKSAEG